MPAAVEAGIVTKQAFCQGGRKHESFLIAVFVLSRFGSF